MYKLDLTPRRPNPTPVFVRIEIWKTSKNTLESTHEALCFNLQRDFVLLLSVAGFSETYCSGQRYGVICEIVVRLDK